MHYPGADTKLQSWHQLHLILLTIAIREAAGGCCIINMNVNFLMNWLNKISVVCQEIGL